MKKLFQNIFLPLEIIKKELSLFVVWIFLVLFGSLLGIVFTFLITEDWSMNLCNILYQGSLFLISISFATAMIADLFSSLILDNKEYTLREKQSEILFFENKVITIVVLIFLIAIMATSYAALLNEDTPDFTVYRVQITSYIVTIFLGVYAFGLKYSYLHEDDMIAIVEDEVLSMKKSKKLKDSKGRKL